MAVLWAIVAWFLGAAPLETLTRRVPQRFAALTQCAAGVLAGMLAIAWMPGDGLVRQCLATTAVVAGAVTRPRWRALPQAAGALFLVSPVALPAYAIVWATGYTITGYPAAGRSLAAALAPVLTGYIAGWPLGIVAIPAALLLLETDRAALRRVMLGTEPRHGWRPQS